jgi:hypothetical protein
VFETCRVPTEVGLAAPKAHIKQLEKPFTNFYEIGHDGIIRKLIYKFGLEN